MKKKLLTVLLAVVMVFGVFNLSACGAGENPADDYNYFTSVYDSMSDVAADDVRIEQLTFHGLFKLCQTDGRFIVFWGGAYDETTKANIRTVQDLAVKYDITVYNFDPCLDGQVGLDSADGVYNTASADVSDINIAETSSQLKNLQDMLTLVMNLSVRQLPKQGSLLYIQGASYSVEVDPITLNSAKVSYGASVTEQRDKNNFEALIQSACFRLPVVTIDSATDGYSSETINEFNFWNDYRMHLAGDYNTATSDYVGEDQSVFVTTTYHALLDLLKNCKGTFAVFFGGMWCHNSQAVAGYTSDLAKDYGIDKVYFYDSHLDGGATRDVHVVQQPASGDLVYDPDTGVISAAKPSVVTYHDVDDRGTVAYLANLIDTRSSEPTTITANNRNYAHLYARLMDDYMPGFKSSWNASSSVTIKGKAQDGVYARMCNPSLILFNGDAASQAEKIVAMAEAELEWGWEPYELAWEEAAKAVFDKNPYATYAPAMDTTTTDDGTSSTDETESEETESSGGSSLPPAAGSC